MLKQILVGLLVAGFGGVLMYFSQQAADGFGRVEWFERNMGSTRNGYILAGFAIIVIGFLILFGVFPISAPVTQDTGTTTSTTQASLP